MPKTGRVRPQTQNPAAVALQAKFKQGVALHQQGKLAEAERIYGEVLQTQPKHFDALHLLGVIAAQTRRTERAVELIKKAIGLNAKVAGAHSNLGNALRDLKRPEEALASYDRAIALKPDSAEAYNNRGNVLRERERPAEALESCDKAIALKPDFAEAYNNRANALQDLKRPEDALASYDKAIAVNPDFVEAHNNRGVTLQDLKRPEHALASYDKAIALKPDFAEAYNNRGSALRDLKRPEDALASYDKAIALKPDYAEAYNNLAGLLVAQGESMKALNIVRRSLQLKETSEAKDIFVGCVKHLRFTHGDSDVRTTLVRALSEPWGRPTDLARAGVQLVKLNRGVEESVARATEAWPQRLPAKELFGPSGLTTVSVDPLLRCLLESVPIPDIDLERFLTMTRHAILDAATGAMAHEDGETNVLDFHCALARQCFINEYVFAYTDDEFDRARSLRDSLATALKAGTSIPILWLVAVAAYFPLNSIPLASQLLDKQWPDAVTAVLMQQIREPEEEQQYSATIPRLTTIEDEVSLLVQRQYEENPYPRWIKAAPVSEPVTIDVFLHRHFPLANFRAFNKGGYIDILIAGCGTGQHSIETAQRFRGARVLAVDLSLTSLCYAKRKTQTLGLNTIEYAQADILKLKSLGRSFDIIESVGVLHHLDDPMKGWQVLLSLLRPGGFMRLGFYSEAARQDIVRARAFIDAQGYGRTAEEIRRGRQELMNYAGNASFEAISRFNDFFSFSECRDLLFHIQEHRLTLPSIDTFLRENCLQFLGFDLDPWVVEKYRARFPNDKAMNDLKLWHIFEIENPNTFAGMYQFYIQKSY